MQHLPHRVLRKHCQTRTPVTHPPQSLPPFHHNISSSTFLPPSHRYTYVSCPSLTLASSHFAVPRLCCLLPRPIEAHLSPLGIIVLARFHFIFFFIRHSFSPVSVVLAVVPFCHRLPRYNRLPHPRAISFH